MTTLFGADAARLLERAYSAPEIVEQRARTRAALGVRPGECGLEVGCGPGLLACELARELGPAGRLVALDASADMLETARARAAGARLADRIEFRRGDAVALDSSAASFDFVVGVQVYLYVKEIARALAEVARVLRPGGRCVIVDTDWDSCVWLTSDRDLGRRVLEARAAEFAQPHLPPHLPRLLREAGLTLTHAAAIPILNLRYDPASFSGSLIRRIEKVVVRRGVAPAEAGAWAADLEGRTGDGDYFFSVNRFLFAATRE